MASDKSVAVLATAITVAAMLVALTAGRWHGRWLYQLLFALLAFVARRRRFRAASDAVPAQALLGAVSPGARVDTLTIGEAEVGVIVHAGGLTGLYAVSHPGPASLLSSDPSSLPALASFLPPADPDHPRISAQLVSRWMPAVTVPGCPARAVQSYQQLTGNRIPVHRATWLAIHVHRDLNYVEDDVLRTALANLLRRLRRRIRDDAPALVPLGSENILGAIESITGCAPRPAVRAEIAAWEVLRERWDYWRTAQLSHATACVDALDRPDFRWLTQVLSSVPAEAVTVSLAARRDENDLVEAQLVTDLAMKDVDSLRRESRNLSLAAAAQGVSLLRLDGFQRAGMANLIPLGGFLS